MRWCTLKVLHASGQSWPKLCGHEVSFLKRASHLLSADVHFDNSPLSLLKVVHDMQQWFEGGCGGRFFGRSYNKMRRVN